MKIYLSFWTRLHGHVVPVADLVGTALVVARTLGLPGRGADQAVVLVRVTNVLQ